MMATDCRSARGSPGTLAAHSPRFGWFWRTYVDSTSSFSRIGVGRQASKLQLYLCGDLDTGRRPRVVHEATSIVQLQSSQRLSPPRMSRATKSNACNAQTVRPMPLLAQICLTCMLPPVQQRDNQNVACTHGAPIGCSISRALFAVQPLLRSRCSSSPGPRPACTAQTGGSVAHGGCIIT
jgi:hypothetical protein